METQTTERSFGMCVVPVKVPVLIEEQVRCLEATTGTSILANPLEIVGFWCIMSARDAALKDAQ
jgi:hypothetical protein